SRLRYLVVRVTRFALRSHMERTRAESLFFVVASTLIALGTLFAVTWVAGFDQVAARLRAVDPVWFATAFGAQCVAYVGYVLAYGHSPSLGLTLPWAISVPLGFVAALWAVERRDALRSHKGRRRHLAHALDSVHVLKQMFVQPRHVLGPLGSAVYWFGDILC